MLPNFERDHQTTKKYPKGTPVKFLYCDAISNYEEKQGVSRGVDGDRVIVEIDLHGSKSILSVHAVKIIE